MGLDCKGNQPFAFKKGIDIRVRGAEKELGGTEMGVYLLITGIPAT